jgi:hypothetical protein
MIFRFGLFELNTDAEQLLETGLTVRLQPQPFAESPVVQHRRAAARRRVPQARQRAAKAAALWGGLALAALVLAVAVLLWR